MQDVTENTASTAPREPASRREREKRARELEILKAARELFLAKGFRETTLDEIAHAAEFGKGTLYNYFSSKEDLFLGILKQALEEMSEIARASTTVSGDVRQKLHQYARDMIQYVKDNGELLHIVYHELDRGNSPLDSTRLRQIIGDTESAWDMLAEPLAEEIRKGTMREGDARQLVMLFDGMLRGFCSHQFAAGRKAADLDVAATTEMITSIFFDGITARQNKG
jgi:AcrR family transcriptional regulator